MVTKTRFLLVVVLASAILIAMWYVFSYQSGSARSYRLARAAAERVHLGMTRDEVEGALSDALLHDTQPWGNWTRHFFFYGTLKVQDTTALGVHTEQIEGKEIVTMYWLVPRYSLCGEYGICSDSDLASTSDK